MGDSIDIQLNEGEYVIFLSPDGKCGIVDDPKDTCGYGDNQGGMDISIDTDVNPCKSSDPLFFFKSVALSPNYPHRGVMTAIFDPGSYLKNNCTLNDVAQAYGFDHFNWIQYALRFPLSEWIFSPAQRVSYIDPPLGGVTLRLWGTEPVFLFSDNFIYYWDEGNDPRIRPDLHLNAHLLPYQNSLQAKFALEFIDEHMNFYLIFFPGQFMAFQTTLVGVLPDGGWQPLYTFNWKSNNTGAWGKVSLRNIGDSDHGSGEIFDVQTYKSLEEIPLAVRQLWVTQGAVGVPLSFPKPDDLDGDGVPNEIDLCPNSDLSPKVVINDCDTEVLNILSDYGCTIKDMTSECAKK